MNTAPPRDPEMVDRIEKLAQYVAQSNGAMETRCGASATNPCSHFFGGGEPILPTVPAQVFGGTTRQCYRFHHRVLPSVATTLALAVQMDALLRMEAMAAVRPRAEAMSAVRPRATALVAAAVVRTAIVALSTVE